MDIRQLQYLVALAQEKHFTRAAQACRVTQPTLSGRIRQLEQELGVPIVGRGHRFLGFTPDGERVAKWARSILDTWSMVQQDVSSLRADGPLVGRLSVGAIPTAVPLQSSFGWATRLRDGMASEDEWSCELDGAQRRLAEPHPSRGSRRSREPRAAYYRPRRPPLHRDAVSVVRRAGACLTYLSSQFSVSATTCMLDSRASSHAPRAGA